MPIVEVQLFPGRTRVVKEILARAVVDAVSEIGGPPREAVHVFFHEIPKDEWAIGPSLVATMPAAAPSAHVPASVTVERVRPHEGRLEDYAAWRRDALLPFLSSQPGFLSSTLLEADGAAGELLVVDKWTSPDAREQALGQPEAVELRERARELVSSSEAELSGRVLDVLHGRRR